MLLKPGHWYKSKAAMAKANALGLIARPHALPDGSALLIFDAGGAPAFLMDFGADPGQEISLSRPPSIPPGFVVQADHGHDLMHVAGDPLNPALAPVRFGVDELPDVEPFDPVKDHALLPQPRQQKPR
jgi:hypothetical protein